MSESAGSANDLSDFLFAFSSDFISVAAPVLLAVIIGVAYQFGFITFLKTPDELNLSNGLLTLKTRLKELENDISKLGSKEETDNSIKELDERLDDVRKILEAVQQETKIEIGKLLSGGIASDRQVYITERDKVIFLILGGLTALQIGLVTSIYFLFRKLKGKEEDRPISSVEESEMNHDTKAEMENNNKSTGEFKITDDQIKADPGSVK